MSEQQEQPSGIRASLKDESFENNECYGNTDDWNGKGLSCQTHGGWWALGEKKCDRAEVPVQ